MTYQVTICKKGTLQGKLVTVNATNKKEAEKKAVSIQPNSGWWTALTAKLITTTSHSFKHKGVRYH